MAWLLWKLFPIHDGINQYNIIMIVLAIVVALTGLSMVWRHLQVYEVTHSEILFRRPFLPTKRYNLSSMSGYSKQITPHRHSTTFTVPNSADMVIHHFWFGDKNSISLFETDRAIPLINYLGHLYTKSPNYSK